MIRKTLLIAATTIATLTLANVALGDMRPPPSPHSPTGSPPNPSAATIDDSRFSEIGKPGPDPGDLEKPPVSAGIAGNRVGNVTYAGARVDVPVSKRWSLIPQVALLHVAPYNAGDRANFNPYVGGGIGHRPAPGWSLEASLLYGPMSYGIESVNGIVGISKELGGDWSRDIPPPVALELAVAGTYFKWQNGNGPAGDKIMQYFVQAQLLWRATSRLGVSPRAMYFIYDKSLDAATGPRLGTISVLSQVGTYAPRALVGGRVSYLFGNHFAPFIDTHFIAYAAGIGGGTQIAGGLKVLLGKNSSVMAMGGMLFNRVGGPLVAGSVDLTRVPVVGTEVEVGF